MLVALGCAASHKQFGESSNSVFLRLFVSADLLYELTYDSDRTVRLSSGDLLRYAKLGSEEFATLSRLLEEPSLQVELGPFKSDPPIVLTQRSVALRHGSDLWVIPADALGTLPRTARSILDLADDTCRRYFGPEFVTRTNNPP